MLCAIWLFILPIVIRRLNFVAAVGKKIQDHKKTQKVKNIPFTFSPRDLSVAEYFATFTELIRSEWSC